MRTPTEFVQCHYCGVPLARKPGPLWLNEVYAGAQKFDPVTGELRKEWLDAAAVCPGDDELLNVGEMHSPVQIVWAVTEVYCDNPEDDSEAGSSIENTMSHFELFQRSGPALVAANALVADHLVDASESEVEVEEDGPLTRFCRFSKQVTTSFQVYFIQVNRTEVKV